MFYRAVAIIRWVTIAYIGALVLPVLFLRYGNIIAVAQSRDYSSALPIATAGLALSHAKGPASVCRLVFTISSAPVRAKSLLLAQVVNLCLSLLYLCHWRDC